MHSYLVNIIQEKVTTYRYAHEPFGNAGKFKSLGTTLTNHICIHGSIDIILKRGLYTVGSSRIFCLSVWFIKPVIKVGSPVILHAVLYGCYNSPLTLSTYYLQMTLRSVIKLRAKKECHVPVKYNKTYFYINSYYFYLASSHNVYTDVPHYWHISISCVLVPVRVAD